MFINLVKLFRQPDSTVEETFQDSRKNLQGSIIESKYEDAKNFEIIINKEKNKSCCSHKINQCLLI